MFEGIEMQAQDPRPLVAGNWKMNGLLSSLEEVDKLAAGIANGARPACDVMLCPPAPLLLAMRERIGEAAIAVGAQDCHMQDSGAHTGDVSAALIADLGCTAVIVGHSERRTDHGETDAMVLAKALSAHRAELTAIVCVGETEAERDAGKALEIVGHQVASSVPDGVTAANLVVAYEPVWAIGTGRTPTAEEIGEVHSFIRRQLMDRFSDGEQFRLLYGGSVKPANAAELMAVSNVDGALVGGASLKAEDFLGILAAYR